MALGYTHYNTSQRSGRHLGALDMYQSKQFMMMEGSHERIQINHAEACGGAMHMGAMPGPHEGKGIPMGRSSCPEEQFTQWTG